MKKYFLFLIAMLGGVVLSLAEMNIYVYQKDGTIEKYEASEVDSIGFIDKENTHNGYEYVDLGLSVKWATMNVGAVNSEDYGDYFAWGEIDSKDDYNFISYKWTQETSSSQQFNKYNTNPGYGVVDGKIELEIIDDVANAKWGGNWRMPTQKEFEELCNTDNCIWSIYVVLEKEFYKVTSKINGNSILFPIAGYKSFNAIYSKDYDGNYWSKTLYKTAPDEAVKLRLSSNNHAYISEEHRVYGLSVRPVLP